LLASQFLVSHEAMRRRLSDLGLVEAEVPRA
jgi:Zn-dependent peptidase ImmA (M78 family)